MSSGGSTQRRGDAGGVREAPARSAAERKPLCLLDLGHDVLHYVVLAEFVAPPSGSDYQAAELHRGLLALSRTCRALSAAALPLLYRHVYICRRRSLLQLTEALSSLRRRGGRAHVEALEIHFYRDKGDNQIAPRWGDANPYAEVAHLLELTDTLKTLSLRDFQGRPPGASLSHLVAAIGSLPLLELAIGGNQLSIADFESLKALLLPSSSYATRKTTQALHLAGVVDARFVDGEHTNLDDLFDDPEGESVDRPAASASAQFALDQLSMTACVLAHGSLSHLFAPTLTSLTLVNTIIRSGPLIKPLLGAACANLTALHFEGARGPDEGLLASAEDVIELCSARLQRLEIWDHALSRGVFKKMRANGIVNVKELTLWLPVVALSLGGLAEAMEAEGEEGALGRLEVLTVLTEERRSMIAPRMSKIRDICESRSISLVM